MQSNATVSKSTNQTGTSRQHSPPQYAKVFDQRKRRVRGLWERNGAYYAQLTVTDEGTAKKVVRRVRLEDGEGNPVLTVPEAVKVMNKLKVLDTVAYIRFASVYRDFKDVREFKEELEQLLSGKEQGKKGKSAS